ncbi:MAG: 6-carboxytetrahydropterin synthase [Thermodesulfobacteriota bacterium]
MQTLQDKALRNARPIRRLLEGAVIREIAAVTRRYRFSAGHRLYIKGLSDEENLRIFDTCSNPNGHGHDYYLEVRVSGGIDPETGMVINPEELDTTVGDALGELDYKRLDIEVPYFTERQPTGENIAEYLWKGLSGRLGKKLVHLRLSETSSSYFEFFDEEGYPYER